MHFLIYYFRIDLPYIIENYVKQGKEFSTYADKDMILNDYTDKVKYLLKFESKTNYPKILTA